VKPWVIDGRVEGYLELGEEITQAANNVSSLLNVDVAVLIHKRCLDRVSWLHGMTLHNGSSDWNDLPDEVVVDRPATIVELPPLADVPDFNSAAPRGSSDLRIDGIPYLAGALPLLDIRGREVGRMVLLRNVATQAGSLHALMFRLGRYFAFLAAACLLGAFAYLNHVEKILCACHQRAVQAHEAREAAQAKHIEDTLLFRKAIEGATDAIALLGPERRLQYVNPAFEKLFGYTVNELTAQGGIKSLYADRKFAVRVYLQLSQGRSVSKEIEMLARENRRVHAFLRANPIFDGDKKMVGFLAVYTDLSERKSIERELLRQSLELADVNRTALKAQNSADAEQPA
jgi:PAS domain S-box-containing protein